MEMTPFYQDEVVTLYCGDAMLILPTLAPVDHVVMDPPYEESSHTRSRRAKPRGGVQARTLPFQPIAEWERALVSAQAGRLARRWVLTFCEAEAAHLWETALVGAGLQRRRWCAWIKSNPAPQFSGDRPGQGYETIVACHAKGRSRWNGGGQTGVFHGGRDADNPHPAGKPESLMCSLVGLFTDPGETILDPFAGTGTTLVAAKRLGRRAIGIERDPEWCARAERRLRQGALWSPAEVEKENFPHPVLDFPAPSDISGNISDLDRERIEDGQKQSSSA